MHTRRCIVSLLAVCDFVERYFTASWTLGVVPFFTYASLGSSFAVYRCTHCRICLLFADALRAHPSRDVELYTSITVFILCLSLFLTCICLRAGSARVLTCLEFIRVGNTYTLHAWWSVQIFLLLILMLSHVRFRGWIAYSRPRMIWAANRIYLLPIRTFKVLL